MKRKAILLAVAAAAALAGLGVWLLVFHDTAEPISVEKAISVGSQPAAVGAPGVPEPGLYVYATIGSESVDVLGGERHDFAGRTAVTVRRGGCGFALHYAFLEGRATTREYCPSPEGLRIRRSVEVHTFFGRREVTDYRCTEASRARPHGDRAGTPFGWSCSTGTKTETAAGGVVAIEALRVAGEDVETVHLRVETRLTGVTRGDGGADVWLLRSTGLPVRLVAWNDNVTDSPIGAVRYRERFELDLQSLRPRP